MGICFYLNSPTYKHFRPNSEQELKIKNSLPQKSCQKIKEKYDEFGQKTGLTLEEFVKFLPLNQESLFMKRIFHYFEQQKSKKVDLEAIYLMISKIQNKQNQLETLFDLYDLDDDKQLSNQEFMIFYKENQNFFLPQSKPLKKNLSFKQQQFKEWASENLDLENLQNSLNLFLNFKDKKQVISDMIQRVNENISQNQYSKVYIISAQWWNKLKCYVGLNSAYFQENFEEISQNQLEPGGIDNSDISGENEGELRPGLMDKDYNIVPYETWDYLKNCFGITDQKHIYKRNFENIANKIDLELYPKVKMMLGVQAKENENSIIQEILFDNQKELKMNLDSTLNDVRKKLFKRFNINTQNGKEYLLFFQKVQESEWKMVIDLDDSIQNYPPKTFFTITKLRKYPQSKNSDLKQNQNIINQDSQIKLQLYKQGLSPQKCFDVQTKDIIYTGIQNQGQSCYINVVLQCLAETPYLSNFLYNQSYQNSITLLNSLSKSKKKQPQQTSLTEELSLLVKQLKEGIEQNISIDKFRDAVTQKILDFKKQPIYSIGQPGDSNEFLKDLLENISVELQESDKQKNTIIETLFQGTKTQKTKCNQCQHQRGQDEQFIILNLNVLEMEDECRLQLIFFKKHKLIETENQFNEIKKERIILQNNSKIIHLQDKIKLLKNLNQDQYEIAYKYQGAFRRISYDDNQQELSTLGIRSKKTIYVYELGNQQEAKQEFQEISQIFKYPTSNFQQFDIVNFKSKDNIWREGQIESVLEDQYFIQDFSQNQGYHINHQDISQFRKNVVNQLKLKKIEVYNYLNQSKNNSYKQICKPMIILIPINQITLQELKVYIYKQIQRFINIYDFQEQPNFQNPQSLQDEFKKFFNQPEFPYRIRLLDKDNKCLYCKKTSIIVNNSQTNCNGCEVDPIILKFDDASKPKIILVWNQSQKYLKQLKITSDYDFQLEDYLKQYSSPQQLQKNCQNCKIPLFDQTFLCIAPIILIIYLQKPKITQVQFEINSQNIKDCLQEGEDNVLYDLYAVINLKQSQIQKQNYRHYTAFVKKQDQWVEFNDSQSKKIDLPKITSKNACLLFYIKQEITDNVKFQIRDFF
ncbi:unnamed protein product [Paramecium sonneborni]|uniref:Ubiquitinyl hydrolase 1 n=1 Tax=Paramecium sonneborni TaxID=65129 RepID=A0A8S1R1S6_9CILI|nr:unnamed protein product [Paramecium sonneborni]